MAPAQPAERAARADRERRDRRAGVRSAQCSARAHVERAGPADAAAEDAAGAVVEDVALVNDRAHEHVETLDLTQSLLEGRVARVAHLVRQET